VCDVYTLYRCTYVRLVIFNIIGFESSRGTVEGRGVRMRVGVEGVWGCCARDGV